jgi:hypothetical protein
VYAAYLDIIRLFKEKLQAAERLGSRVVYIQTLDAELAKATGMDPVKQGKYLETQVGKILERLRQFSTRSAEHALYKPLAEVVKKCRGEHDLPPATVHRHSVYTNPEPLHGAAAHAALEKVTAEYTQKLAALQGRNVGEFFHLCTSNGLAGKVYVACSPGFDGLAECLQIVASARAWLQLRGAHQRSASLTAFHDLSCDKLAVADQKLVFSIMVKVLAPGQRNDCPYKDERNQAVFSDKYFAWPEGVPWQGISLQNSADLVTLFDAAASFASQTNQWVQVMNKAHTSARDRPLVLQVLQSAMTSAANNARRAPRDGAEPVNASDDDADQGGVAGAAGTVGAEPHLQYLCAMVLTGFNCVSPAEQYSCIYQPACLEL